MKERLDEGKLMVEPGQPMLGVIERAYIECGCSVWVGARLDNMEAATAAVPCSQAHRELMSHFNVLLHDSLEAPSDAPLVDVCELLLEKAASGYALGS